MTTYLHITRSALILYNIKYYANTLAYINSRFLYAMTSIDHDGSHRHQETTQDFAQVWYYVHIHLYIQYTIHKGWEWTLTRQTRGWRPRKFFCLKLFSFLGEHLPKPPLCMGRNTRQSNKTPYSWSLACDPNTGTIYIYTMHTV